MIAIDCRATWILAASCRRLLPTQLVSSLHKLQDRLSVRSILAFELWFLVLTQACQAFVHSPPTSTQKSLLHTVKFKLEAAPSGQQQDAGAVHWTRQASWDHCPAAEQRLS